MFSQELVGTPSKPKPRRHCSGCGKTLWGGRFTLCASCRDDAQEKALAGKKLCIECGVAPIPKRRRKCTECRRENLQWQQAQWRATNSDKCALAAKLYRQRHLLKARAAACLRKKTEKGKAERKRYKQSEKGKAANARHQKKYRLRNAKRMAAVYHIWAMKNREKLRFKARVANNTPAANARRRNYDQKYRELNSERLTARRKRWLASERGLAYLEKNRVAGRERARMKAKVRNRDV